MLLAGGCESESSRWSLGRSALVGARGHGRLPRSRGSVGRGVRSSVRRRPRWRSSGRRHALPDRRGIPSPPRRPPHRRSVGVHLRRPVAGRQSCAARRERPQRRDIARAFFDAGRTTTQRLSLWPKRRRTRSSRDAGRGPRSALNLRRLRAVVALRRRPSVSSARPYKAGVTGSSPVVPTHSSRRVRRAKTIAARRCQQVLLLPDARLVCPGSGQSDAARGKRPSIHSREGLD